MDMVYNCVNDNGFVAVYELVPIEECSSDFLTEEDMNEISYQHGAVMVRQAWSEYGTTEQHWQRYATDDAIERMIAVYNDRYSDNANIIKATESNIKDMVMCNHSWNGRILTTHSDGMLFGSCNDRFESHCLVIRIHEFDSAIRDVVARLRKSGRRSIDHGFDYEFDDRVDYMNDKGEIVNKPFAEIGGIGYYGNISSYIEEVFRDRVSTLTNDEFCIRKGKLAYKAARKPRKTKNQLTKEKYGIDRDTMRDIRYAYAVLAGIIFMEHLGLDGEFTYPSERKNQAILRQKMHELNHTDEEMVGRLKQWHSYQLSDRIKENLTVEQIKVAFDHIAVEEAEKKEREAKKKAKAR